MFPIITFVGLTGKLIPTIVILFPPKTLKYFQIKDMLSLQVIKEREVKSAILVS